MPELPRKLKGTGLDPKAVDEFISLLARCNVHTFGALTLFSNNCKTLVAMMYETSTALGALQAEGFLAALRVSPRAHARKSRCPCEPAVACSCRLRMWLVSRIQERMVFHLLLYRQRPSGAAAATRRVRRVN